MIAKGYKISISNESLIFRIKSDITRTNISQLRNELDNLKIQIHKYDVSIDDIAR